MGSPRLLVAAAVLLLAAVALGADLPGCQTYAENRCAGNDIITPDTFENHRWFTPPRNTDGWQDSFQDYSELVAHAHVVYSDTSMTSATVELVTVQRDPASGGALTYLFGGVAQTSNIQKFDTSITGPLSLAVTDAAGHRIDLDPVDFRWNAPAIPPKSGDYRSGQKGAIVEFFGWPHTAVEQECSFLATAGYLGAKVFPAMEQVMSYQPFQNMMNPWYFMYQPVSYRLQGRMGTRDQLRSLIHTCRSLGVRLYADAVINHMTGGGNDANPKHRNGQGGCTPWGNKTSSLPGGHSPMYTQSYVYSTNDRTGQPASQEFPAVPYGPTDFHCERTLSSWSDPLCLNAGWLTGLVDLNTEKDNVQARIADYITDLIGIGFSGIRIDAAKHIQPDDLAKIFGKVAQNLGGALPDDFISWLEVLLGGESDLLMCNPASGYNYGSYFEGVLHTLGGLSPADINKIKIWNSGYPKETDHGACTISKVRNAIQNDDHDQQNPGSSSRDMGDDGCVLIKGCPVANHRAFEVKLFANPNGINDNANEAPIRLVLSSYYWINGAQGVPDGLSLCSLCTTTCNGCVDTPYIPAYSASSTGYDSDYTRVHRDSAIISAMRHWMGL